MAQQKMPKLGVARALTRALLVFVFVLLHLLELLGRACVEAQGIALVFLFR